MVNLKVKRIFISMDRHLKVKGEKIMTRNLLEHKDNCKSAKLCSYDEHTLQFKLCA